MKAKKVEFKSQESPAENVPVKTPEKDPKPLDLKSWTVDIRETQPYKSNVTKDNLDELFKTYEADGKKITQLYCTDTQAKVIKDLKSYKDVILTVE